MDALAGRGDLRSTLVFLLREGLSSGLNVNFEAHTSHLLLALDPLLALDQNALGLLVEDSDGLVAIESRDYDLEGLWFGLEEDWLGLGHRFGEWVERGGLIREEGGLIVGWRLCYFEFVDVCVHLCLAPQ